MLNRLLDDSFDKEIRRNITAVTVARLVANAAYRFAPLFLATIARGFEVSLLVSLDPQLVAPSQRYLLRH